MTHSADKEFELLLAEAELTSLDTWGSSFGLPAQVDVRVDGELGQTDGLTVNDDPASGGVHTVALLAYLRKRNRDRFSSVHWVVQPYELVDLFGPDKHGNLRRKVATLIGDRENVPIVVPLDSPFDMSRVYHLSGLSPADRICILTELVRIFGNLVRFASLPESILGNLVRSLGELVRSLRATVGYVRGSESEDPNKESGDDADPLGEVSGFHESSPLGSGPGVGSTGDSPAGILEETPDIVSSESSSDVGSGVGAPPHGRAPTSP